ncbi:MAG: Lipid A biosynthesis lauroyltransferase [Verrucomicrobiae bacterium]|nr:Lipid A biosynthesis lauroyltransferase [Verrucomicrobiae bacterium]
MSFKYLQMKFAETIGRFMPRRIGYGIARRFADAYVLFDRRGRECVINNLQRIHLHNGTALSRRALRVLARENFLNFAKYLVDFFHFLHLSRERADRLVNFGIVPQVFDDLLARGKGLITLSAHLGNWELGAAVLAQRGYPINAVALWQPDPKLNALYQSYRTNRGIIPIPFGRAARECIAALRRNEIVAVLGDRDYTGGRQTVEFFGRPARLPDGPAKLALATGAPILPAFMVRVHGDTFAYVLGEPIWADRQHDSVDDVMKRVAGALEEVIRAYSEQWYLFHDLWDVEGDRRQATAAAFGAAAGGEKQRAQE